MTMNIRLALSLVIAATLTGCNDHIANTADTTQPINLTESDLRGRTLSINDIDGTRDYYLSDQLNDERSSPEQAVFCAGDISLVNRGAASARWWFDASSGFPHIHFENNRQHVYYIVDSVSNDLLHVHYTAPHGYRSQDRVFRLQPLQLQEYAERTRFFNVLNTGKLSVQQLGYPDDSLTQTISNSEAKNHHLLSPTFLTQPELSFDQDGRYTIFHQDGVARQGTFTPSHDGQWLILDEGCSRSDYWKIRYWDGESVHLEIPLNLVRSVDATITEYEAKHILLMASVQKTQ